MTLRRIDDIALAITDSVYGDGDRLDLGDREHDVLDLAEAWLAVRQVRRLPTPIRIDTNEPTH